MNELTWLHLSDWHQKGSDFDRTVVRDALLRDVRERASIDASLGEVGFVIFSGDVAFHGKAEEFQSARECLFEPVLKELSLPPDKLFIVPGNHDLSRQHIAEMLPPELAKPLETDEQVQKWLTDERRRNRALEPFEDFAGFVAGFTGQKPAAYANSCVRFVGNKTVGVLCLNSAWMCGRNIDAKGEVNDYGHLILGEPQLHQALSAIQNADVRLAVLHHPFAWLAEFDRNRVEERLKRECHFILHGHEHQPKFNLSRELSGECAVIPAGACYDRRIAKAPRHTNACNFVHLDFDTGQGFIFLRRWSDRRDGWIEDTDSHFGGKFPFRLPKELGSAKTAMPAPHLPPKTGIFICYRRDDSSGHAGRLYDKLQHRFGDNDVFMDLPKIKPGEDFREVIRRAVEGCGTMLVLIGKRWLTIAEDSGRRRLDAPDDPVRFEIEAGLRACPNVIPVRLQGAEMPRPEQLPNSIKRLASFSATELSDSRWDHDVGSLMEIIGGPGAAPDQPVAAPSPAILEYLRRLEAATSKLQLIGLGQGVQIELPIQLAYIPLNVVVARDLKNEVQFHFDEKALREREHVEENVQLCDIFKWAVRFDHRGVLLLGDPGAGKTTGARQFCWRVLNETNLPKALGLPAGTVPVLLRLRELTAHHLAHGLTAFITDRVAAPTLAPGLAQPGPDLLARKGVLWIFDGLDEVVNENARVHVCGWIKQALADRPDDFFLVTSRYQGYQGRVDLGPAFCQFHVKPLNTEQVAKFVDHWYRAVCRKLHGPGDATEDRAAGLFRSLMDLLQQSEYRIGRLRELPANPLMLTILCVVHHQDRNLPRRRADLYAKCVRVLVEHWRKDVLESQGVAGLDPEAAEGVLSSVAWWLHEKEGRVSQTPGELGVVAGKALADLAPGVNLGRDGPEFIKRMRDESGILTIWSAGQCGFLHLTFQEYLAGLFAARENRAETLVRHVGQSWWREVILVAVAVGSRDFSRKFFAALLRTEALAKEGAFVDQCLDEARYAVIEPFIEALREKGVKPERQLDILRRLRQFTHPDLVAVCRDLARAAHPELSALAREVLQRAGGEVERPAIEVVGAPLELRVDQRTGIAFITIPAGEFDMGSKTGDSDEKPVHRVRISQPFPLGRYPVTNQEYQRFLEANSGIKPPEYWSNSQFNDPQKPVVGVSWKDAQIFCQWAGCRLPTEAEWEYACRAGSKGRYCFGDDEAKLGEYAWYHKNSGGKAQPVGQKKPNTWGLYDMHGNVWEWCQDWFASDYYNRSPKVDPTGPEKGGSRVLRGGSWGNDNPANLRSAYRNHYTPDLRNDFIGFRCVWVGASSPQAGNPLTLSPLILSS